MDNLSEKKWFVYLGDHHEGPFSLNDIEEKIMAGLVTSQNYVWKDGMSDWKVMTEIQEFFALVEKAKQFEKSKSMTKSVIMQQSGSETNPQVKPEATGSATQSRSNIEHAPRAQQIDSSHLQLAPTHQQNLGYSTGVVDNSPPSEKKRGNGKSLFLLFILVLLGGAGYLISQGHLDALLKGGGAASLMETLRPHLLSLNEKVPALSKWISPIPQLDDVEPVDFEGLKAAAIAPTSPSVQVAVAASKADPLTPSLYVAANVPDGTVVEIYVVGNSDTLLNQLSFSTKVAANIQQRLGKSNAVTADGKPIPRGEYSIYAVESESQPPEVQSALAALPASATAIPASFPQGKKVVGMKSIFLGGPKDDTYHQRLKAFHEKLIEKSGAELMEAKQFAGAINGQFGLTNTQYDNLKKKKANALAIRKAWGPFHKQWQQFTQQLDQSFQRWTPEALQNEYFYGRLFSMIRDAGLAVMKVHDLQNTGLNQKVDPTRFTAQLSEARSQAQVAISAIQAKIEEVERTPPSPGGLPKRME